ncbi:hypothetical protein PIB30_034236 [Stylosanthes scabra]|uniref:Secreted protein n=1 Tax=Stylosanthes scabra TaxID=79078 RepID=A0ABU6UDA3_9FABA|nr:hypothetical protein [Stylosanthes scabra]
MRALKNWVWLPLFIDAASLWCVRIGALGACAQTPFLVLDVPPKSSGCVRIGPWMRTHRLQNWPPSFSSGIRIDYVTSKDGARQKMSCHKSLQPVQKYRVWDSGRSPNELTQGTILVVRKSGVAIVCV